MFGDIYSDYPPTLDKAQEDHLVFTIKNWAAQHGLTVRPQPQFISKDVDSAGVLATTAPVSMFPTPFPRSCYQDAREIQSAYNELYAAISRDEQWLAKYLEGLVYSAIS